MSSEAASNSTPPSRAPFDGEIRGTILRTFVLVALGFALLWLAILPARVEFDNARSVSRAAIDAIKTSPGSYAVEDAVLLALQRIERRSFLGELLLHVAIALFVAAAIVFVVEIHSRRRMIEELSLSAAHMKQEANEYQQLIGLSVFEALFRRKFPPLLVKGLESIFDSDVFKERVRYDLRLFRYPHMPSDRIVVRRVTSFRAWNVSARPIQYPVRSRFIEPTSISCRTASGEEISLPRHTKLLVDNEEQPQALQGRHVEHITTIAPRGHVDILMSAEEHYGMSDHAEYVQMTLSSDVHLTIVNTLEDEIAKPEVLFLHPNIGDFLPDQHGDYRYEGVIVPGQAIQIEWRPRGTTATE